MITEPVGFKDLRASPRVKVVLSMFFIKISVLFLAALSSLTILSLLKISLVFKIYLKNSSTMVFSFKEAI